MDKPKKNNETICSDPINSVAFFSPEKKRFLAEIKFLKADRINVGRVGITTEPMFAQRCGRTLSVHIPAADENTKSFVLDVSLFQLFHSRVNYNFSIIAKVLFDRRIHRRHIRKWILLSRLDGADVQTIVAIAVARNHSEDQDEHKALEL